MAAPRLFALVGVLFAVTALVFAESSTSPALDPDAPDDVPGITAAPADELLEYRSVITDYPVTRQDRINSLRAQLILELKELQDEYCRRAMLDEALAVRDQIRTLQGHSAETFPELDSGQQQTTVDVVKNPWTYPSDVSGQFGQSFFAKVTGTKDGSIWGTGIYTDDSHLAKAAVHAGVLQDGETKIVRFTMLPGQEGYPASDSHGVQSSSWESWSGSFRVDGAADEAVPPSQFRNEIGMCLTLYVTGHTNGSIWGTGIYTDDSDIATAAVHAGVLKPGESDFVTLTVRGPQDSFAVSKKNGVGSAAYGPWEGSFSVQEFVLDTENTIDGHNK